LFHRGLSEKEIIRLTIGGVVPDNKQMFVHPSITFEVENNRKEQCVGLQGLG
jgi:hypothetical protein